VGVRDAVIAPSRCARRVRLAARAAQAGAEEQAQGAEMTDRIKLTDKELLYAATARCQCGAGLAHPLDHELAMELRAWVCSAVLKGEVEGKAKSPPFLQAPKPDGGHDALDFACWKVREEGSVNDSGGNTTRPSGTVCRTIRTAHCPKCDHRWESEPYDASTKTWDEVYNGKPYARKGHWLSGPCPNCGNDNHTNNGQPYRTENRIDDRGRSVVLDSPAETPK
jgi:hypothetical protein